MYLTDAKPSDEQRAYMEGLGFKMMKTTQHSSQVTWVLPVGDPFNRVDGQSHAISIEIYSSEIPKVDKLLVMIGKKAYKFGWDTKLNEVKKALDIPSGERFPMDI